MPSDLTAAVEAAKRIVAYVGEQHCYDPLPQELAYGFVARKFLELTSQPLYRRRKAEWKHDEHLWNGYRLSCGEVTGKWYAYTRADKSIGQFPTKELAQAACEEHFWRELERDVLERIN